jgi:hypothetical protein
VKAATALWGSQSLGLLEAEDRLSVACEKGDTQDEVLLQLRQAYQVGAESFGGGWAERAVWVGAQDGGGSLEESVCFRALRFELGFLVWFVSGWQNGSI